MSDYDPNGAYRAPDSRRLWMWVIGLVALALIVGAVYSMSSHGGRSVATDGAPASTAQAPARAPAASGGAGRR
jgi:hypothetical protein